MEKEERDILEEAVAEVLETAEGGKKGEEQVEEVVDEVLGDEEGEEEELGKNEQLSRMSDGFGSERVGDVLGSIGLSVPKQRSQPLERAVVKHDEIDEIISREQQTEEEQHERESALEEVFESGLLGTEQETSVREGDLYRSREGEEKTTGDFYNSRSEEDPQMYESGNVTLPTETTTTRNMYDGPRVDARERAWVDNRRWNEGLQPTDRGIDGKQIRERGQGETFIGDATQDGFAAMSGKKPDYESRG